ncbi:FHA domain-containing protein [Candidatus Chloroploca sp. M-50]|uniref:FHA domain-containing protein n=1 Tax=Candidatus Chloroploca mongolica TaxID=2528176 RepID=A0ABS4D548_9CHLR|nr:adenylate/guanylate cyclase domain-containing protein [Candidatus Chloroploca mongolica]MBP1464558.1 FHA domain-containing protein [Candidatus Chloroploca mongolica]
MARITVTLHDELRTFAVATGGLSLGRQLDNAIVLNHPIVSRRHARIEWRGRQVWVKDLDSRNGVTVNRLRVKEEQLTDGDIIGIGPFELQFEDRAVQSVFLDDQRYYPLASDGRTVRAHEIPLEPADLQTVYMIGIRLNQVLDFRELLDLVMEEVLQVVPAERGLLLLRKDDELVPRVVLPVGTGDVAISSTIVRKAIDAREAILTRDARLDFAEADSIISANMRSAICAPLLLQGSAIGIILLDAAGRDQFGERERDLVVAIANFAAVAIERARLTEELRHQGQLRQNLERFLSPNVAHALARYVAQHGKLWEAQEQQVSVLFADIKGFTSLAEQLSPREVQDLLNEYLHEMTDVIFRYNGTVDKYIGDGIMAVFGAPRLPDEPEDDQHAFRAVAAALEMQAAQRRLVSRAISGRTFAIRIGVNTGMAYTGFFGTRHRLEYTAIGDTVNTASRLEGAAEPGSVFIGQDTADVVCHHFDLQAMGELQLKGKQQRVRAFKVLKPRETSQRAE